jgi:hypothetical protein
MLHFLHRLLLCLTVFSKGLKPTSFTSLFLRSYPSSFLPDGFIWFFTSSVISFFAYRQIISLLHWLIFLPASETEHSFYMFCFYRHFESNPFNLLTLLIHPTSFHLFSILFFITLDNTVKVKKLESLTLFETRSLDPSRLQRSTYFCGSMY